MPASALCSLRRLSALALIALVVLAASVVAGPVSSASAATPTAVSRATNIALSKIGDPYRYGAAGPAPSTAAG